MGDLETFRADAAAWLGGHAVAAPRDYGAIVPPDLVDEAKAWQRLLFDEGWAGLHWPEAVGGRGLTPEHQAVWLEEAARASVPPFLNMVGLVLMGGAVQAYGTDEQKAEHLLPTLRGDRVWCQLFSEPEAGSDLANLATRAVDDGDDWVVSGQKTWCSNGRVADWGILLARTDPAAPRHAGISFLLVDMRSEGVSLQPIRQMTGGSEFDEVFFDEVHVPKANLVGPLHGGWGVAMATLTNERNHIGAVAVSLERRMDEFARTEGAGTVPRDTMSELVARGRVLQQLGLRQGPTASTAASLMKLGITELLFELAETKVDKAGPAGMLAGDVTAGLVGAPGSRIAGGTSQVQRNIIGELLLGLPREPRPLG
jgi:alkylation response protein AidB-like acyl-CoA dehydrogenase